MSYSWWWLVVDALAVYRLAILVTKDELTRPLRRLIELPYLRDQERDVRAGINAPKLEGWRYHLMQFSTCPWCVSVWLAAGAVALTKFAPGAWQYGAMLLALSGVAGYLSER